MTRSRDAYRYTITGKKFEKIAEMKEERNGTHGAAAQGKIFVIGGERAGGNGVIKYFFTRTGEVYNETTGEWQLIAGLRIPHGFSEGRVVGMISIDDKLFALGDHIESLSSRRRTPLRRKHFEIRKLTTESFDPDKNEWSTKTKCPNRCN